MTAEVADGHHGFARETQTLAQRIPAEVTMLSGYALERAQQIDPRATHSVLIRYRTGLRSGYAVVYHDTRAGDRRFEIVGAPREDDERHRDMTLLCKEAA